MVLEIKIPKEPTLEALYAMYPIFEGYILSYIFVGIYWTNHHHLLHTVHHVTSGILWSNLALLFCLSLIPISTGWLGISNFQDLPVRIYGINLLACAISYSILQFFINKHYKHQTELATALQKQRRKGIISLIFYTIAILVSFIHIQISIIIFALIAILWLIPDENIEKALEDF